MAQEKTREPRALPGANEFEPFRPAKTLFEDLKLGPLGTLIWNDRCQGSKVRSFHFLLSAARAFAAAHLPKRTGAGFFDDESL